jgi:aspartyl-tRNA(Asn)/glutamyl-tRNA(Gln) amidotransferase subunit B
MRIEPNVSVRPLDSTELGTRVEIKNLNSFRALERSVAYEIKRQISDLRQGKQIIQQTVGWDESQGITVLQRVKEEEDDYRYFPEPDLPPLVIDPEWIEEIRAQLPELPIEKLHRFHKQYGLNQYDAGVLVAEQGVADYFEQTAANLSEDIRPKTIANWITGELFGLLNQHDVPIEKVIVLPQALALLIQMVESGEINQNTAKAVLAEMFTTGKPADEIVSERGLQQISDSAFIAELVNQVITGNPEQVEEYVKGKDSIAHWLFGQVMRTAKVQANPQVLQRELDKQLSELRRSE